MKLCILLVIMTAYTVGGLAGQEYMHRHGWTGLGTLALGTFMSTCLYAMWRICTHVPNDSVSGSDVGGNGDG